MAIDIRATVICSLGTLISATLSDDYVQGTGLIKCKGSCEISGTITPAIGTVVTFSYTKGGVTRSVPRKLRVLSSFADPFRRTTKVELGCKLTYLQDLQEPLNWDAFDDPENAGLTEADARIITIPIYASSVMDKCLTELGITASSNPLTNKFSIAAFDFGSGYVSILSDLLVSESYCGYLDTNEVLQVFALDVDGGTGPVLDSTKLIDIGSIGVGQLPGEAVTVSYSTLKLKDPDPNADEDAINWEASFVSSVVEVPIIYTPEGSSVAVTQIYSGIESTQTFTTYTTVNNQSVVQSRISIETRIAASVAGSLINQYLTFGLTFPGAAPVISRSSTYYLYDGEGNEIQSDTIREEQLLAIYGDLGLDMVFSASDYVVFSLGSNVPLYKTERVLVQSQPIGNYTNSTTQTFGLWNRTIAGQQSIAQSRESLTTANGVVAYVNKTLSNSLNLLDVTVETRQVGRTKAQARPSEGDRTNAAYAKDGDPDNGWRTESSAELELALGSATAQRRIEFSLPYAPDDIFSGPSGGPFTSVASDAPAKAARYGRAQNRLLLGNRSGMNIQLEPERLPAAPFSPIVVQANGLSALYRANGTSWTMDSNGILVSTDALFWGAVGGTGTFWFPVAPGITTLPAEPAIVDGQMTVGAVVPVWNETVIVDATIRLGIVATSLNYALELLTLTPVISIRTQLAVSKVIVADAGTYVMSGQAATLLTTRIATGAPGSFVLGGQEALFFPPVLSGESGAYNLGGQAANLIVSLRVLTGTQAPLLGAGGATSSAGWTLLQNASEDDAFVQTTTWPFTFTLNSIGYTNTYVGSNTYLTFGAGSDEYTVSVSNPNLPKLMFGAADNSYQRVYTKTDTASDGSGIMRIRYEGTANTSGTVGSPNIVAEFAFYAPRNDGTQWVELRVGNHSRTSGVFNIANATTAYASSTITANSSWVFAGNAAGTSWTLTSNRYIA